MTDDEKIPLAHFLISNDDQDMVLNQVLAFHEKTSRCARFLV